MNTRIKSAFAGVALLALTASGALAQYPGGPMGVDVIGRQMDLWTDGIRDAQAGGWAACHELQRRRMMGLPVPNGPLVTNRPSSACGPVWDPIYRRYNILCR